MKLLEHQTGWWPTLADTCNIFQGWAVGVVGRIPSCEMGVLVCKAGVLVEKRVTPPLPHPSDRSFSRLCVWCPFGS